MVSSMPRPHFTPGKDPVPILQEAGWAPGPVGTGGKSRPYRDSIPDRPVNSSSNHAGHSWPSSGIEPGFLGSPVHSPVTNRLSHRRSMLRCLIQVIVELINLLTIIHDPSPRLAATHTSHPAASLLTNSSELLLELPSAVKY